MLFRQRSSNGYHCLHVSITSHQVSPSTKIIIAYTSTSPVKHPITHNYFVCFDTLYNYEAPEATFALLLLFFYIDFKSQYIEFTTPYILSSQLNITTLKVYILSLHLNIFSLQLNILTCKLDILT